MTTDIDLNIFNESVDSLFSQDKLTERRTTVNLDLV